MRVTRYVPAILTAGVLIVSGAGPAAAANGAVTVFETEAQSLTSYNDPGGCHKLPLAAHVLVNETDRPVTIYGDPFCLGPSLTVAPGHGAHVAPGSGSFSA